MRLVRQRGSQRHADYGFNTADAENKHYYAKWSAAKSYTVQWNLNDNTPAGHPATNPVANLTSYTVLTNGSGNISLLPALRNGYTFLGWYDNAALTGTPISSFSAMDAAPKNFYAKWSAPKSYTVQYSLNDAAPAGHPAVNPNTVNELYGIGFECHPGSRNAHRL